MSDNALGFIPKKSELAKHWQLDPQTIFLNHGSFGACPTRVRQKQLEYINLLESQPVKFFVRNFQDLLEGVRTEVANFVQAPASDIVFVRNATEGVNTVLASLTLSPGDEVIITDHIYPACKVAIEHFVKRQSAKLIIAEIPFPISSASVVAQLIFDKISPRTRLLLIDHVTSPTGLIFPLEKIIPEFKKRGVIVLVDGAHAPGMLDLNLNKLGADFYTGNFHKWVCAPKSSAFLYVAKEFQDKILPLILSHGAQAPKGSKSEFHDRFDWQGTFDPSALLSITSAISFIKEIYPNGWPEYRTNNRQKLLAAATLLADSANQGLAAPTEMLGLLYAHPILPLASDTTNSHIDEIQNRLFHSNSIEVPIFAFVPSGKRLIRISAAPYNSLSEYEFLCNCMSDALRADN